VFHLLLFIYFINLPLIFQGDLEKTCDFTKFNANWKFGRFYRLCIYRGTFVPLLTQPHLQGFQTLLFVTVTLVRGGHAT
jgi:hypothetical protein